MGSWRTTREEKSEFNSRLWCGMSYLRKRPNILVCGYTGSGKSSLIRAVFGGTGQADCIGSGASKTTGYDIYENDNVRICHSKGLELGETESQFIEQTRNFVRTKQDDEYIDNHIHLVWYTIQGPGASITDCDKNLINNVFCKDQVIVVITKDDIISPAQREALQNILLDMGIPEERIVFTCNEDGGSEGCEELIELSLSMLPDGYKTIFEAATEAAKSAKQNKAAEATEAAEAFVEASEDFLATAANINFVAPTEAVKAAVKAVKVGTKAFVRARRY